MTKPQKLVFPCDYPIKVVGRVSNDLRARIDAIFERHFGPPDPTSVSERGSAQQNFVSITYVVHVKDPAQIEPLHLELRAAEGVLLVL